MTLMNRLFGDWTVHSYAVRTCPIDRLSQRTFADVLEILGDELYDRRTGTGRLVLFLPGRITERSAVDLLAVGDSREDALAAIDAAVGRLASDLQGRSVS
jgi:hypothetical protein